MQVAGGETLGDGEESGRGGIGSIVVMMIDGMIDCRRRKKERRKKEEERKENKRQRLMLYYAILCYTTL